MDLSSIVVVPFNYPSISQMNEETLKQYKVEETWVQDRQLFCLAPSRSKRDKQIGDAYQDSVTQGQDYFKQLFINLQRDEIYLDIGAGDGNAIIEYRQIFPQGAQVIGLSKTLPIALEKLREREKEDIKFSYYLGDFNEIPTISLVNRVSLITDIKSAFLYSLNPVLVIQQMGKILKQGGVAIIDYGQAKIKIPQEYISNMFCSTKNQTVSGSLMHIWFRMIKGFDYIEYSENREEFREEIKELEAKNHFFPEYYWFGERVVILKRNQDPIEVDRLICHEEAHKMYEIEKWPTSWTAEYTWELSERSKNFLSKQKKIGAYL